MVAFVSLRSFDLSKKMHSMYRDVKPKQLQAPA